VPDLAKSDARNGVPDLLARLDHPVWVRVNDVSTTHWSADLDMLHILPLH
jgi:citrate lyase beta subunit